MSELKACPFCGGEAKLKTARESDGQISYDSIYVACLNCRSTGLSYTTYYNVSSNPEEEAIAAWNRRARPENVEETKCRCPCGEQDDSFCPICTKIRVQAIKEKLDRENPKSLTPDELKQMYGEPVYLHILDAGLKVWAVVMEVSSGGGILRFNCGQNALIISDYGKTWLAYRRKPERSEKE